MALLDVDTLKASKNQAQDIEAALTALKKDNDYLFQSNVHGSAGWFHPLPGLTMMFRLKKSRQMKH